jgi:hypothetical protein
MLVGSSRFEDLPDGTLICHVVAMKCGGRAPFRAVAWEKLGAALCVREITEADTKEEAARLLSSILGDKFHAVCPVEEGRAIHYLPPDAISLSEAIVASYGVPLRTLSESKMIGTGDTAVDKEGAVELREAMIKLRDGALEQGDFQWAVTLSHVVAFMANAIEEIWPQ